MLAPLSCIGSRVLKKLLSNAKAKITSIFGASADGAEAAAERAFQATVRTRDRYWAAIGAVETDVLGHAISPSFTGGPDWPTTRQAYRVIRRERSIILATDGMADPFEILEGEGNGFGMELFLETSDVPVELAGKKGDLGAIVKSWAFSLLKDAAYMVADAGGYVLLLDRYGVVSMEFPGARGTRALSGQVPERFITDDDSLGVLVGGPDPDFPTRLDDMPLSPVRMVPVVLITAAELEYVREGGAAARRELAARLAASPSGHRSDLNRPSLEGKD
jgi:hypothetical protein